MLLPTAWVEHDAEECTDTDVFRSQVCGATTQL